MDLLPVGEHPFIVLEAVEGVLAVVEERVCQNIHTREDTIQNQLGGEEACLLPWHEIDEGLLLLLPE
jgi:hypothetical protein